MRLMLRSVWLAGVVGVCLLASAGAQGRVVVRGGVLQGVTVAGLGRGGAFLGIPFAAQPVGELRWKAPEAAPRWKGVRKAEAPGPACPQGPSGWLPEMAGVREMATDEACLTLNVWTPELHPKAKLAVFVWVHGGGNVEGAADWPPLGESLAERGVVVVSINYRLGVLGFLAGRTLAAESGRGVSGNYGLLDQLAALRWVRENIARFGGDPERVTIGGQSSGSLDVCTLMTSPLAAGLFARAILESGVCVDSVFPMAKAVEGNGERLAKDLGVADGAEGLKAMRGLPAERILQAAKADGEIDEEPVVDGWVLPEQPAQVFAEGKEADVAVLVGSNEDEISIFASPLVGGKSWRPATVEAYRGWLRKRVGGFADAVFAAYPARVDGEARRVFEEMDADFDFGFGAWLVANDMAGMGAKAFLYHFSYVGRGAFRELGAFHGEEEMFVSGRYWTSWVVTPEDRVFADVVVGYWVGFIKSGDPNGPGLPAWPVWRQDGLCQELGPAIGPEVVPRVERFGVFQDRLTSRLAKVKE